MNAICDTLSLGGEVYILTVAFILQCMREAGGNCHSVVTNLHSASSQHEIPIPSSFNFSIARLLACAVAI